MTEQQSNFIEKEQIGGLVGVHWLCAPGAVSPHIIHNYAV